MSQIRIGFDFDGTLVDSNEAVVSCLIYTLNHFYEISESQIRKIFLRNTGKTLDSQLLEYLPKEILESARKIFLENYKTIAVPLTKLNNGARPVLEYLKNINAEVCILSAKSKVNLQYSLRYLKLDDLPFESDLNPVEKMKQIKMRRLEYYVGDQPSDYFAAIDAGAIPIMLSETINDYLLNPKGFVINNLEQIVSILKFRNS